MLGNWGGEILRIEGFEPLALVGDPAGLTKPCVTSMLYVRSCLVKVGEILSIWVCAFRRVLKDFRAVWFTLAFLIT